MLDIINIYIYINIHHSSYKELRRPSDHPRWCQVTSCPWPASMTTQWPGPAQPVPLERIGAPLLMYGPVTCENEKYEKKQKVKSQPPLSQANPNQYRWQIIQLTFLTMEHFLFGLTSLGSLRWWDRPISSPCLKIEHLKTRPICHIQNGKIISTTGWVRYIYLKILYIGIHVHDQRPC